MKKKLNFMEFMNRCLPNMEDLQDSGQTSGCGSGGCGSQTTANTIVTDGGCSSGGCSSSLAEAFVEPSATCELGTCGCQPESEGFIHKPMNRRDAIKTMVGGTAATFALAQTACSPANTPEEKEEIRLKWSEYFKGNFREMTEKERASTIQRLERLAEMRGKDINVSKLGPQENVLYGYAFNIGKCKGYRKCVDACVHENNQDRDTKMQYIRIFEMENGKINLEDGKADYFHAVPREGHYYIGTQCFQCENPPCVKVCPVGATWKEKDGIIVIDYDWCIGCRYCQAACPYWARRFNWAEPKLSNEQENGKQHYLSNRKRKQGVMEKCTFCLQRTRKGENPACVEACPTGARVFGNLLDPQSEIRKIIASQRLFRLKEELGTEPKFWYYMDQ